MVPNIKEMHPAIVEESARMARQMDRWTDGLMDWTLSYIPPNGAEWGITIYFIYYYHKNRNILLFTILHVTLYELFCDFMKYL